MDDTRAISCAAGSYGAFECTDAPAGFFVADVAALSATACEVGTFSPLAGAISCDRAELGFYVSTVGSATQTACAANQTTIGIGSTSIQDCIAVATNPRETIQTTFVDLETVVAGTSGRTNRILTRAIRVLNRALRGRNWTADGDLTDRGGRRVFQQVANALNEIERIADSNSADAVLRAELDVLTGELLDTMRSLVVDKISEAEAAGGSQRRINRANATLARGDQNRSIDWLRGANTRYGNAWAWAQSAL